MPSLIKFVNRVAALFPDKKCTVIFQPHLFKRTRDFAIVARRVLAQSFLRPLPFYAIVSVLIGYTVLFGVIAALTTQRRDVT